MTSKEHAEAWEIFAFISGVLILLINAFADTMIHLGFRLGECEDIHNNLPIGVFLISALLVAPYTIGRASAGSVWRAVPDLVLRIFGRAGNLEAEARMSKGKATTTTTEETPTPDTTDHIVDVRLPDRRKEPPAS